MHQKVGDKLERDYQMLINASTNFSRPKTSRFLRKRFFCKKSFFGDSEDGIVSGMVQNPWVCTQFSCLRPGRWLTKRVFLSDKKTRFVI